MLILNKPDGDFRVSKATPPEKTAMTAADSVGRVPPTPAMTSNLSVDDDQFAQSSLPATIEERLVATVVEYDRVPDECTIHPVEATDEQLMTRWVTALEGSFVSLPDTR